MNTCTDCNELVRYCKCGFFGERYNDSNNGFCAVAADFQPGQRVRYVPGHAHDDITHPDCEDGTVSSLGPDNVRVRFDKQVNRVGLAGTTAQSCTPSDLVPL